MRIAITGGTGLVGRFLVLDALDGGDDVTLLGRSMGEFKGRVALMPYRLGEQPDLGGYDLLIHCAFAHVPGKYRGGEGDDATGFIRANLDGTATLFQAARNAGVKQVQFLSSRAVYGDYPPGTVLDETLTPRPDTLYGQIKWDTEQILAGLSSGEFSGTSLRATGVYGPAAPGQRHKWADLFDDFRAGRAIAPRRATELHGADLAAAARLCRAAAAGAYNLSDMVLDRHDLLALVAGQVRISTPLPPRAEAPISQMRTDKMRALGWRPGGMDRLKASLPAML